MIFFRLYFFVFISFSFNLEAKEVAKQISWKHMMSSFIKPLGKFYEINQNKKVLSRQDVKKANNVIESLLKSSHKVKFSKISYFSNSDTTIEHSYDTFVSNLKNAKKSFPVSEKRGMFYLNQAVMQCASCHSNGGPSKKLFHKLNKTKNLSSESRVKFALAVRDFDTSLKISKGILFDQIKKKTTFEVNKGIMSYLNSALLASKDKKSIINTLVRVQKLIGEEKSKKIDIENKIKDISRDNKVNTLKDALKVYSDLVKKPFAEDKSYYSLLLLKNYIHKNIGKFKNREDKARSYLMLGDIYSQFSNFSVFTLPEKNYEMCVLTLPKTKIAKKCFERYKERIISGYSGSSGIKIPQFEERKIREIEKYI